MSTLLIGREDKRFRTGGLWAPVSRVCLCIGVVLSANCTRKGDREAGTAVDSGTVSETRSPPPRKETVPVRVASVIGDVRVNDSLRAISKAARPGMPLHRRSEVETDRESRAEVTLGRAENLLVVNERTRVSIDAVLREGSIEETQVVLPVGEIFVDLKKMAQREERLVVRTPTAIAAVRGTGFSVRVEPETGGTEVSVVEGVVELRDLVTRKSVRVKPAQTSSVEKGRPPAKPAPIGAEDVKRIKELIGAGIIKRLRGRGGAAVEKLFERGAAETSVEELRRAVRKEAPGAAVRREAAKVKERVEKQSSQAREQLRTTAAKKADVVRRAAGRETAKVKREVAGRIDRTVADSTSLRARRASGNARKAAGTKVEQAAKKAKADSAAARVKSMGSGLKKKFGF